MSSVRVPSGLALAALLTLGGCSSGPSFISTDAPWRADEEQACLASSAVRTSPFIQTRSALGGPSVCGAARPFEMSGALGGRVAMNPPALLRCPMVPQVERWVRDTVAPAARHYYGADLAELKVAASYSCRPRNNVWGGKLSEHGFANALDVSGFTLADGRRITVKGGWYGDDTDRRFLRDVQRGACREFTTVLGPESDRYHRDHFHVDLARHGRDGLKRVCG